MCLSKCQQVGYTGSNCGSAEPLDFWASKAAGALDMLAFAKAASEGYDRASFDLNVVLMPLCSDQGFSGIG